jgi:ABC-type antimicrobial peptide transport system permease subunit
VSTGDGKTTPSRIVGVVGDARERGLNRDPGAVVYTCFSAPNPTPYFLVRAQGEPEAIAHAVRVKVKGLEPLRAVYEIAPLRDRIGDAFAQNRLRMVMLMLFAATALSLACVGLYGTLSYMVNVRRREVGLRLALGALRSDIARGFLMQGLRVTAVGCACGLVLALALTRTLSSMLYGVSPSDPMTILGVVSIVLVVAVMASLLPAIRAARSDPMHVLRSD